METGTAWEGTVAETPVDVDYTRHFIDRYEDEERDRPAPSRYLDEGDVLETIQDALPEIEEKWRREGDMQGVITSASQGLNMSFVAEERPDGLHIVMKNMMLKGPFQPYRPYEGDVLFKVAGADAELAGAVHDHIALSGARPGTHATPEAVYTISLRGRAPVVERMAWARDTYVFRVR